MFCKSGEVISDQFEPLKMFSFWENSENGSRGGGVPTRVVESGSREVGKSLKIGKNRIKSEKSDLISY